MKKDIEWLKAQIRTEMMYLEHIRKERWSGVKYQTLRSVSQKINQLDETEVLSQEWISENVEYAYFDYAYFDMLDGSGKLSYATEIIRSEKLKNLIVPKQEELETKIQELIESYKQEEDAYSNPENGWIGGFIEDLKNLVEKEQKYYVLGKYDTPILLRDHRNRITETSNLSDIYPEANSEDFEFTEQEIKDFDPRYWAFAKPVE